MWRDFILFISNLEAFTKLLTLIFNELVQIGIKPNGFNKNIEMLLTKLRSNFKNIDSIIINFILELEIFKYNIGENENIHELEKVNYPENYNKLLDLMESLFLEFEKLVEVVDNINPQLNIYKYNLCDVMIRFQQTCPGLKYCIDSMLFGCEKSYISSKYIGLHDPKFRKFNYKGRYTPISKKYRFGLELNIPDRDEELAYEMEDIIKEAKENYKNMKKLMLNITEFISKEIS